MRRRRRSKRAIWEVIFWLGLAIVVYITGMASLQAALTRYRFVDLLIPRAIDCLVVGWLFWVGSSIGSFLNVVAWRMPRGRSINGFSHCPWCNHRLAARDNWPVFGWIVLRGRCRTCRLPISPRYPIVEACVGLTMTLVGIFEVYDGLVNLPFMTRNVHAHGPLSMPIISTEIVIIAAYHAVALAGSWALGLVRFDGQKLPGSLIFWVLGAALIPMLAWWPLAIVPWQAGVPEEWPSWSFLDSVMRALTALVAAVLVARTLARQLTPAADPKLNPTGNDTRRMLDLVAMLAVPALVVGWQALLTVVVIGLLLAIGLRGFWGETQRIGGRDGLAWLAVSLPVALAIQLIGWRLTEASGFLPAVQSPPYVILLAALLVLILPAWLKTPAEPRDKGLSVTLPSTESD